MIFAYLPKSDLKLIRLVCRIYDDLAIKRLFNIIYFLIRFKNINVFILLTNNKRCRPAVKRLNFNNLIIKKLKN